MVLVEQASAPTPAQGSNEEQLVVRVADKALIVLGIVASCT